MAQAYDFALDKVGLDINSFSIWTDYIIFLKNVYVFYPGFICTFSSIRMTSGLLI